jgi:hemolysin III
VHAPRAGPVRPLLRGVTHQWAFVASIFIGAALVLSAPSPRAQLAAVIYALSVVALFGSSAL